MSDVPELDKLLAEHENYTRNMRWTRRERFFTASLRFTLLFFFGFFAVLLFGWVGWLLTPFVYPVLKQFIPDPKWRDPFARYTYR